MSPCVTTLILAVAIKHTEVMLSVFWGMCEILSPFIFFRAGGQLCWWISSVEKVPRDNHKHILDLGLTVWCLILWFTTEEHRMRMVHGMNLKLFVSSVICLLKEN